MRSPARLLEVIYVIRKYLISHHHPLVGECSETSIKLSHLTPGCAYGYHRDCAPWWSSTVYVTRGAVKLNGLNTTVRIEEGT